jgi:exodeoxyribonuclease VII small subunit
MKEQERSENMAQNSKNGAHGDNKETFEQSFQRLQQVVQKLSEGNLTLGEALTAFEEGMALADSCAQMLDEAELRVSQVSEKAIRAGAASVTDIDRTMREGAEKEEPELVSFEIETFESVVFDNPTARRTTEKDNLPEQRHKPPADDLDPLFDEDD